MTFDDEEDDDFASGAQDSATDFSAQSRPRRSLDFSDLVPKGSAAAPARSSKALDFSDLVPKVPPGNVPVPQARPPIEALLAGPRARPADAPPPTPLEPDTAIDRVMRGDDPADVLYGQPAAQAPAPDRTAPMEGGFPAPQSLDEAPFRSGGSVIDKLYGTDSGMLSGNEAYGQQQGRLSQSEQAVVAAQTRRDEAKQAYDEAVATTKLSGTPFDAGVQRGAAQRTRVSGAKIALDNAEKELAAAKIAPLPTQTGTRDTMERAPGAAVDQATQTVRAAARIGMAPIEAANEALTSAMGTVRPALDPIAQADKGLDDATRAITDTFSRQLFSKDEAQNERLGSKVVQGVVSTGMFAATGAAGRLAGFSPMWTTAIAGALPQAEGQFQQARSAQEINPTYAKEWMKQYGLDVSDKTANALVKWSMFATGLGIGATEAVPVAHLFERLEKASGGGFTRWIGIMAAQAGEEGLQEGVQQLLENAAVKGLLDPNRSIGKDVADNAMVGAISGALVSGVMAGPSVLAGRGAHPGMPAPAEPAPADLTGATPPPGAPPGATPPPPVAAPAASPHQEDLTPPAGPQEATPPTTEPPQAPEQTSPVSAIERRTLRKMGYADEMIDGMNRAEAEAELGTAAEQGIEPGEEEAAEPAGVPEAAEGEKPDAARDTNAPDEGGKSPAVDFSDLLPDGSRRSPAKITDQADIERAGAKVNTSPSEAQKEAGNYQKGHLKWKGLDFTIENPAGSIRSGKDADGTPWQAQLPAAYGYIKRTTGRDGDHVDVYFQGDGPIHVIDQIDPKTGKFDEHKVVIGPQTAEEASALYRSAFNDGDTVNRIGAITELTPSKLKAWLRIGKRTRPLGIIAKPAQETDKTGLSQIGEGGRAIVDNMYDAMWSRVEKGLTTEAGNQPSALMQAAKRVRDAGGLRTRDDFIALAHDYAGIERGPTFQADMRALVQRHMPAVPPVAAGDPPLAPGHVRLYRGEAQGRNEANGGYYSTDREMASGFGKLRYVDLPADAAAFFKMPGMGGKIYNLTDYEAGPGNVNWRARSKPLVAEETSEPESMAPTGGAPTQDELHGEPSGTTDAAKAVDDALAAIGIPSEQVDATDLSAAAKIVEETGAEPAAAFVQVMADQLEETTDAADSAGTVSDGLEEGKSGGQQAEGEQLPGRSEAGGEATQGDSAVEGAEPDRTGNAENAEDGATGDAAEAENAGVAAKPTEAEEKAASDAIEGALNKIEEAVEAKDRAGVLAAARAARKVLSDTPQAIKDAEPEYWGQFSAVIRRMAKPGYVTATQEAKAAEADVQAADTEEPTTTAFVPTALDKPATEDENKARIEDAGEKLGGARNRTATLADTFATHLSEGGEFKNILAARKMAKEAGFNADAKAVEEAMELGVVQLARQIVADRSDPKANFTALVDLYSRQPKLGTRTSTSMRDQAFSTPVPLAYVASRLAEIGPETTVYEPTAGNGALLIEANPAKATANEINEARAANLISLGFKVTQDNAVGTGPRHGSVQAVIANPPFGAVRQEGSSQVYDLSDIQKGYKTKEIDHAIALRALQTMKDDGRAVLIIGGLNKLLTSPEARSDAYNSKAKREFFKTLYDRYNVSDHFTVAGELYERQGAGWPVDVIVIDGRGKSERSLPAVDVPRVLTSWDQLGGLIDVSGRSDSATDRTADGTAGAGPGERDGRGRGDGERVSEPDAGSQQPGEVQPGSVQRPADERSRGEGPAESAGNERGDAERTGDEPPASGRPPGLTAEEAVDAALDELLGPQAGPKSSESPIGLDNVSSRRTSGDEVTFGKFKGYASTNDGGRLSVDAYGATAAEAQKNAVAKLNREFSERAAKRTPPVRTTPQVAASAATNAVASADAAFSGLYQLFGAGKTAGTLGAFDESTYAKAKPLFMQAAEKFAAFKNDIGELAKRMVTHMRDALKWPTEAIARMRPYLIQFIKDVQSGAVSLTQAKTETKAPAAKATEQETDKQVAYAPQSKSGGLGTLVPVNMRSSIQEALARIEKKVGPLDTYVAKELGYETDENGMPYFERDGENVFPFAAEQIDAIALAIDNINRDKGFIIGDQTGIGKGRVNAGILRWAMMNDRIPIFVSAKPNLYGDMYRDLSDIGIQESLGHDLRILATNSGLNVPLTEDDKPVVLKTGDAVAHKKALNAVTGENFTDNYDVLFTTYNQMQTVAGKDTDRRGLLQRLGSNAVLAFDESHEAGGQGAKARKTEKGPDNRADFARDLIKKAKGVFYSSATYAKRPDVMDLYAATDMSMAVEKAEDLGEAIARGGVPMQQVVAAMLAKAGQYIRRERSFAGVTYATPIIPVNRELYDQISGVLASIQDFSVIVQGAADNMDADIKAQAEAQGHDNAVGGAGASSLLFTSIMHNVINQMLLALKAGPVAKMAIEALKNGQKPVITLANTMESLLSDYAAQVGLKPGDVINADFGSVLTKYLDRTRTLIIKKPFSKDPVERKYLTDEELGAEGLSAYNSAKAQIESISGLSDLPASPIDRIKQDLADAGYKVGEITGRGTTIDYSGDEPVLRNRPGAEMSIRGRRETLQKFNNGGLDGMILNQAGSTGLSAHASEKYKDQRQRHMMIAQAEGNIDTHMQMLGRVHRTGQVVVPTYSQLVADIPAEKRPAAVLAKKMASLNANTTASREGALTSKDVPDFINQYGDMIAATIIADDLALNHRLGNAIKIDENGRVTVEDAMRRLTGRIPLLPLGEQEELYSRLEADYDALLEQMNAAGENALEAQTLDLKARPLERTEVVPAKSGLDSPFAQPVSIEKTSILRQGKPFSATELVHRIGEQLVEAGAPPIGTGEASHDLAAKMFENLESPRSAWGALAREKERLGREEALGEFDTYKRGVIDDIADPVKAEKERVKLDATKDRFAALHQLLSTGARITLKTASGNITGIVIKTERTGEAKNPLALSSWKTTFAVADAARQVVLPFSRLYQDGKSSSDDMAAIEVAPIGWIESPAQTMQRFADMQNSAREERYIATGNLLAAYDWLNLRGRIINYTDAQGHIRQGILTSKDFDLAGHFAERARPFGSPAEVIDWMRAHKGEQVWSEDNVVRLEMYYDKDLYVTVEGKKRSGGQYFLDKPLTDITNDFYKRGGTMVANVQGADTAKITRIIERLQQLGARFVDRSEAKAPPAEKIEQEPEPEPPSGGGGKAQSAQRLTTKAFAAEREITYAIRNAINQVAGWEIAQRAEVVQRIEGEPHADWAGIHGDDFVIAGEYDYGRDLIKVALANNPDALKVAYHEAWHSIERVLTPREKELLARETERLREFVARNTDMTRSEVGKIANKEVFAESAAIYAKMRSQFAAPAGMHIAVRRIFEKLREIMTRIRSALNGMGFRTAEDIFADFKRGEMARRRERADVMAFDQVYGRYAQSVRRRAGMPGDVIPAPETVRGAWRAGATWKESLSGAIDALLLTPSRTTWDRQIDMLRFQKAADAVGAPVTESLDMYLAATLFPGRAGERMKDVVKEHWEPIYDAMRDRKISRDDMNDYLYARHAPERNEQIRKIDADNDAGSGMTDEEAAEIMGRLFDRRADFEAVAALADKVVAHNRNLMLREGLESERTLDNWAEAYDHYMPLKGFEAGTDDELSPSPSTGKGFDIRYPETYRAMGRFDRADDILANLKDQTMRTVIRAEKNRVAKTVLRFAQANPSPFYKVGLLEKKRRINPLTNQVEEYWANLPDHLERVFAAKVGGKTYYIEIKHEGLLGAVKSLGMTKSPYLLRLAMRLTREYSRFQTAKNPEFVLRNFTKDIQDAVLNISAEQKDRYLRRLFANYPKAFAASVLGTAELGEGTQMRRWYDEWREAGGKISFYGFQDIEEIQKDIDRELNRRTESTAKSAALALPRLFDPINGKIVKTLEAISEVSESTTRLAVYMAGRDIGLSKAKAAEMARNATVDFNRRGDYGHIMSAFYAFSGANIQGNVNTLRRLRKSKTMRRAAYSLVVAGMLTTLWNMAVSPEDEEKKRAYEKLKYWQREKNIHIYVPGMKRPLKLPTGFAVVPFWMMGENLAMRMLGKVTTAEMVGNYLGTVVDAFNPLGSQGSFFDLGRWARTVMPTVIRPVAELPLNQNWAGNKIHPDEMPWNRHLPHSELHKAFTNPYAVEVAQWLNSVTGGNKFEPGAVSPYPDDLQYLWDFALGGLGRFVNNTSKTIADTIDGIDVPPDRMPFVRNFVGPDTTDSSGQQEAYYKKRTEEQAKTQRLRAAVKARADGTDDGSADAVVERLAGETGARPSKNGKGISVPSDTIFRSADTQIKDLRKQEDVIRKDEKLSRAERKTQIDALRQQMRDVMGEARQRLPATAQ